MWQHLYCVFSNQGTLRKTQFWEKWERMNKSVWHHFWISLLIILFTCYYTSTKGVIFSMQFVCVCVCLYVCLSDSAPIWNDNQYWTLNTRKRISWSKMRTSLNSLSLVMFFGSCNYNQNKTWIPTFEICQWCDLKLNWKVKGWLLKLDKKRSLSHRITEGHTKAAFEWSE